MGSGIAQGVGSSQFDILPGEIFEDDGREVEPVVCMKGKDLMVRHDSSTATLAVLIVGLELRCQVLRDI